jgi:aryl-alcohol dehydrogenase-like predicted oxidoreductase
MTETAADIFNGHALGLGTWQWGDWLYWNYGHGYAEADLRAAFGVSLEAGIAFIDTAEVYGRGRSERFLGRFMQERGLPGAGPRLTLATKFMPFPWRLHKGALKNALRASLERLGVPSVDLYQMHWPFPPVPIETWMDALAGEVHGGRARAAGVSNYDVAQTRRAYAALKQRGLPLASNQVPYSLLDRHVEKNGLLALCQELGVRVIAYSPLAQGLLTGKYTLAHPPPGVRRGRYALKLAQIDPLIKLLRQLGEAHGGKTPAQVALNWTLCKGTLPIPGAKNAAQAQENAGALGWRLTAEEVTELDQASDLVVKRET